MLGRRRRLRDLMARGACWVCKHHDTIRRVLVVALVVVVVAAILQVVVWHVSSI